MTILADIFDLGLKPKKKKKKQIYLNKQEKAMKRKLAKLLSITPSIEPTLRGYTYYFSYQHGGDIHECSGVNDFIKSITNKECYTEKNYSVSAYSILGNQCYHTNVNVNDLKEEC